jgi:hypothetical protein
MSRVVASILPYTLLKRAAGAPLLVFLVWRDRRSSAVESSTYWGSVVCPSAKDDNSPLDAVTRGFSEKTKGVFAPATMVYDDEHQLEAVQRKSPPKRRIEDSRIFMRKKIIQGNGVTILTVRQYITYVAPVRYIDAATLNSTFGMEKGEVEWVSAQDLFGALYSVTPDNAVAVRARTWQTADAQSTHPITLALALPFTVTMRTSEARKELADILKQFNVDVDASIVAPPSQEDAPDDPDVGSLSLGASAAAASSSSAASSSPATPARAPQINYACRKCRKVLFTDIDLTSHTNPENGGGKFAHKHIRVSEGGRRVGIDCSSYFVENNEVLGDYPPGEGPLNCSKCQTRYGTYVWSGTQCSCGEWIAPAFQVVKSKVDERPAAGPTKTAHVSFQFQRPPPRVAAPAAASAASSSSSAASSEAKAPESSAAAPAAASSSASLSLQP